MEYIPGNVKKTPLFGINILLRHQYLFYTFCVKRVILKVRKNIDDVRQERRYYWIILQWSKSDFKSRNGTTGDYFLMSLQLIKSLHLVNILICIITCHFIKCKTVILQHNFGCDYSCWWINGVKAKVWNENCLWCGGNWTTMKAWLK